MPHINVSLPDDVHARIKEMAEEHRRSIKQEIIVCLEQFLTGTREISEIR